MSRLAVQIIAILAVITGHRRVEAKLQIDVSIPLGENVCEATKKYMNGFQIQPELKSAVIEVPTDPDMCYIWRWTKCEYNHKEPCSTWVKTPCPDKGTGGKNGFCDIYQCGWTLDELYNNWGYNPEHVRPLQKILAPNMEIVETGSTIDFPKSANAANEV